MGVVEIGLWITQIKINKNVVCVSKILPSLSSIVVIEVNY